MLSLVTVSTAQGRAEEDTLVPCLLYNMLVPREAGRTVLSGHQGSYMDPSQKDHE